jgi:hypothetical protein
MVATILSSFIECRFFILKANTTIDMMNDQRRRDPPAPVQEADSLRRGESDLELCSYTALKTKLSVTNDHKNAKDVAILNNTAAISEQNPKRNLLIRIAEKSIK